MVVILQPVSASKNVAVFPVRAQAGMPPSVKRTESCLGCRTVLRGRGGTGILGQILALSASSVYLVQSAPGNTCSLPSSRTV